MQLTVLRVSHGEYTTGLASLVFRTRGPRPFLFERILYLGPCDGGPSLVMEFRDSVLDEQGGEYATGLASLVFGPRGPGPFFFHESSNWGRVTVVRAL